MAKDKKGSKAAAPAVKPTASKPVESVKAGRVTKPAEQAKSVAKEAAKKTAKVVEKSSKKSKKEPEPVDDTSDSSASSDDESEDEVEAPVKVNGHVKAVATKQDDSDDDSESDAESDDASDSDEEVATAKTAAPKTNGAVKADEDDEDEDDDDDDSSSADDEEDDEDDSDSDSDAEIDAKAGANGGAADTEMKDDDDSSDASDSEEEEEEKEKPKVAEKKRKAEDSSDQVPKKSKVMVNGEQKDPVSNLFVGNLSWNIDEEWLTREFEDFGELKSVRIITDRDSGRSKGFGYVEFVSVNSAITAVEEKSGELVDGREIRIDFSAPRPPRDFNDQTPKQRGNDRASKYGDTPNEPSSTLFVGNVSFRADESVLTEVFQEYGTINAVRLPTDRESGELKGFGYVEFSSIDEAKGAFEALNGQDIAGRAIRLDYSKPRDPNSSPRGGFGGRGGGGFDRGRGGRGGRGGFNDRGRGRGGARGGRGVTTNRGGFGDFSGRKTTF